MRRRVIQLAVGGLLLSPQLALAQFKWESTLQRVQRSIEGPVAISLGTVAIMLFGLAMAVSDGGAGMSWALRILFGLSIVFTAGSLVATLFA